MHPWKRKIIFQTIIFRFYVNLRGCNTTVWVFQLPFGCFKIKGPQNQNWLVEIASENYKYGIPTSTDVGAKGSVSLLEKTH